MRVRIRKEDQIEHVAISLCSMVGKLGKSLAEIQVNTLALAEKEDLDSRSREYIREITEIRQTIANRPRP